MERRLDNDRADWAYALADTLGLYERRIGVRTLGGVEATA
jgi:hypothetical protein